MNNNKLDIDGYTKKIVGKGGIIQPGNDFTKNVMGRILKDPAVKISFITKNDKQSNIWLIISMACMIVGYLVFFFIKNGFSVSQGIEKFAIPAYIKVFIDFFSRLWTELSLSPYVLLAIIGVVVLVVLDRTIVKYLYSI